MPGKILETMTWDEIRDALPTTQAIIIPLGAKSKEHGLHLPMNTDYLQAEFFGDELLKRFDKVLAAPTIAYHYYPAFLQYPGSISLSLETAMGVRLDICRSLHAQGFKNFYFLNTGISTLAPLKLAQERLQKDGIQMAFSNFNIALEPLEKAKVLTQEFGSHADEAETSLMLVINENLVQMPKAKRDMNEDKSGPLTPNPNGRGVYSPTGAWGDPTLATFEKGEKVKAAINDYLEGDLRKFLCLMPNPVNTPKP